jgi:hypothetical protein
MLFHPAESDEFTQLGSTKFSSDARKASLSGAALEEQKSSLTTCCVSHYLQPIMICTWTISMILLVLRVLEAGLAPHIPVVPPLYRSNHAPILKNGSQGVGAFRRASRQRFNPTGPER